MPLISTLETASGTPIRALLAVSRLWGLPSFGVEGFSPSVTGTGSRFGQINLYLLVEYIPCMQDMRGPSVDAGVVYIIIQTILEIINMSFWGPLYQPAKLLTLLGSRGFFPLVNGLHANFGLLVSKGVFESLTKGHHEPIVQLWSIFVMQGFSAAASMTAHLEVDPRRLLLPVFFLPDT